MFVGVCVAYLWVCASLTNDDNIQGLDVFDGICMFSFLVSFGAMALCLFNRPDMVKAFLGVFSCLTGAMIARAKHSNVGVAGNALGVHRQGKRGRD